MEKSLENDRLRNELKVAEDQSKRHQEDLESKLQMLTLDHSHACLELEKVRMELTVLNKEKEHLANQVRQLDKGSVRMDDFQILQNQLHIITKERDKLMTQIEDQHSNKVDDMASCRAKDEVMNNKEKTKLRMRLRGTQAMSEAFSRRYEESVQELDLMNRKYEEAASKLKSQLASYGLEVLNLKKELAAIKSRSVN
ncbi:hypothetical protein U1Q18_013030 [Sarracenia purpurea var. burkii]